MIASFDKALAVVLKHEGGFVNDAADPGGATNYGVSIRYLKARGDLDEDGILDGDLDHDGDIDVDDIRRMTPAQAGEIYRTGWWDKYGYGRFSQSVAIKLFDMSVNMGAKQAHKLAQRACNSLGSRLADDGQLGPQSVSAIQNADPTQLYHALCRQMEKFYRDLVAAKPSLAKFEKGWLRRAWA